MYGSSRKQLSETGAAACADELACGGGQPHLVRKFSKRFVDFVVQVQHGRKDPEGVVQGVAQAAAAHDFCPFFPTEDPEPKFGMLF